jgi:hypothetical protein
MLLIGCSPGKFGIGCKESCPSNCKHDVCGYVDGDCDEGCKLGFQGEKCKECNYVTVIF